MSNKYSDYFTTIYDQTEPVGNLGRGTHYSVLRYASWFDVEAKRIDIPQTHDFAVIWDEDHDTRVIQAIEKIYKSGLLSPIQFIGERKAFLSIVVAAKFYFSGTKADQTEYAKRLEDITSDIDGDYWNLQIGFYDKARPDHQTQLAGMIACGGAEEDTYLRNIDNLWQLGTKPFKGIQTSDISGSFLVPPTLGN
jgi:hypothetical protein